MAQMVYAVVRRPYANYNKADKETLVRMFATFDEADNYVKDRVLVFRPDRVFNPCDYRPTDAANDDCWVYEYGMPDTDTTIAKAEFPQYAIRPFYIEGK